MHKIFQQRQHSESQLQFKIQIQHKASLCIYKVITAGNALKYVYTCKVFLLARLKQLTVQFFAIALHVAYLYVQFRLYATIVK